MPQNIELLQSLSAKLCHDLAGSIGALDSCLGLIGNDNEGIAEQAKDLAIDESSNLVRKIKFYRIAYGVSEEDGNLSLVKLSNLLQEFFESTNIKIILQHDSGVLYIDALTAKAILCLLLITGESNIYGGEVILSIPKKNTDPIVIKTSGKNIVTKDNGFKVLDDFDSVYPVEVSNCREHYIKALCNIKKYELEIIKSKSSLEFKMHKNKRQ